MSEPVIRNLYCDYPGTLQFTNQNLPIVLQQSVNLPFDSYLVAIQLSAALHVATFLTGVWILAEQNQPALELSAVSKALASLSTSLLPLTTGATQTKTEFLHFRCRPYFFPAFTAISLYAAGNGAVGDRSFCTASLQFQKA